MGRVLWKEILEMLEDLGYVGRSGSVLLADPKKANRRMIKSLLVKLDRVREEEARERGNNCWAGDMRDPESYRGKYDVIVNWFSSFGYFSHRENVQVMENFYEALDEGGILLLDFPNFGNQELLRGGELVMRRGDNIEIMEEGAEGKVRKIRIRLFKDLGDRLILEGELKQDLWAYTPEELKEMAEDAGFEVHLFETYRTRPLSEDSRRVTLVGIKGR